MARKNPPGRKKELHGSKLHDSPKLELEVVKWLGKDPKLSHLAISKRLLKEFKFKLSGPSIRQWKSNYYVHIEKQLIEKVGEQIKNEETLEDFISLKRLDYIKELKALSKETDERIVSLKEAIDSIVNEKDVDGKTIFTVSRTYLMLEGQYESFIKTKAILLKQIGELIGPDDWADKVGEIMKRTLQVCIEVFKPLIVAGKEEEAMDELTTSIKKLQQTLKEEFLING